MTTLRVKNRLPFGIVPNALLEDKRLSLQARALAAWLVGRADGFEIRIEALKKMLGITDKIWVSVRKELEKVGWWKSEKFRVPSEQRKNKGRPIFKWQHTFEFFEESTCIPPVGMDASCRDADGGDKQRRCNHQEERKDIVVVDNNSKKAKDKTSHRGKDEGQEQGESQSLSLALSTLLAQGVNEKVARKLADLHSLDRIKESIELAEKKKRSNKPGFIVKCLEQGWYDFESAGPDSASAPHRIPPDIQLTEKMYKFAKEKLVQDPAREFEAFKDYFLAKGTEWSDWDRTWMRWVNQGYEKRKMMAGSSEQRTTLPFNPAKKIDTYDPNKKPLGDLSQEKLDLMKRSKIRPMTTPLAEEG